MDPLKDDTNNAAPRSLRRPACLKFMSIEFPRNLREWQASPESIHLETTDTEYQARVWKSRKNNGEGNLQ